VILPQELVAQVFEPLLAAGLVEKRYMSLIVVQFIGILQELGISVDPLFPVLAVRLMHQAVRGIDFVS